MSYPTKPEINTHDAALVANMRKHGQPYPPAKDHRCNCSTCSGNFPQPRASG
jgi:hypothetical protein